jgi:hypothetical protein
MKTAGKFRPHMAAVTAMEPYTPATPTAGL